MFTMLMHIHLQMFLQHHCCMGEFMSVLPCLQIKALSQQMASLLKWGYPWDIYLSLVWENITSLSFCINGSHYVAHQNLSC